MRYFSDRNDFEKKRKMSASGKKTDRFYLDSV